MIFIDNRQTKVNTDINLENKLIEVVEMTLKEESVNIPCEVSIIFVDNSYIKSLNCEYRNIDKETDVLSFPMLEYEEGKVFKDIYIYHEFNCEELDDDALVLGDVCISLEKAKEQSIDYGHSFLREVCYLSVHSILHLLGYDHMNDYDKAKMRQREEEILLKLDIQRLVTLE